MLSPKKTSVLFSFLLFTASVARPAAISVNGSCEVGSCTTPGTLAPGQSTPTTSFSFDFTLPNTDTFKIHGNYSASGNAPSISFDADSEFLGNATHTASGLDTLSVDLLQNFSYIGSPNGTYQYSATLSQKGDAPGSSVTSQLSFGGQDIGLLGPLTTIGSETLSASRDLNFGAVQNPTLLADFNYTFVLGAGSSAIPEPASVALGSLGTGFLTLLLVCRKKWAKAL